MAPAKCHRFRHNRAVERMQKRRGKVRVIIARFNVVQHVRISKEKAKFAKYAEQNFSTENFRIIKVIHRSPRPVYELEDLNRKVIDGNFTRKNLLPYASRNRHIFRSIKSSPRGRHEALSNTWSVGRGTTRISTVGYREFNMDIGRYHFYVTLFSNKSILAPFSRHTSHIPSIWERRHPSGKWAYVKSHMGARRTSFSKRIRSYLFIATSSRHNSWRIKNLRTLRIIHYPSRDGEHRFQNVYYLPVEKRVFRDINIQMRLMDDSTVPFEAGILHVKMVNFWRVV